MRDKAVPDPALENELGQLIKESKWGGRGGGGRGSFGNNDHNFISFKIDMDKTKIGSEVNILYWGKLITMLLSRY